MTLDDATLARLVAYVHGEMTDEVERCRFSQELVDNRELETAYNELARIELLSYELARRRDPIPIIPFWKQHIFKVAALLVILPVAGLIYLLSSPDEQPAGPTDELVARVGVVRTGMDLESANGSLRPEGGGDLASLADFLDPAVRSALDGSTVFDAPPDTRIQRGGDDTLWYRLRVAALKWGRLAEENGLASDAEVPSDHPLFDELSTAKQAHDAALAEWRTEVDGYLALAQPLFEARIAQALAAEHAEPVDDVQFVHVAVRPEADCSALVFLVTEDGELLDGNGRATGGPVHPSFEDPWGDETARLEAGVTSLVPEALLGRGQKEGVEVIEVTSGLLVPRRVRRMTVVVGLRIEALDDAIRDDLRAALAAARPEETLQALRAALDAAGFVVLEREVAN